MPVSARLIVNQAALKTRRAELQPLIDAFAKARAAAMKLRRLSTRGRRVRREARGADALRGGAGRQASRRAVRAIIADVRRRGDAAVLEYTRRFDGVRARAVWRTGSPAERISTRSRAALPRRRSCRRCATPRRASGASTSASSRSPGHYAEADGTRLGQHVTPLERVGLYVPGGKAAYPSSVLMNAIPAKVAGVARDRHGEPQSRTGWCSRRRRSRASTA